jgi:Chondroitinase B
MNRSNCLHQHELLLIFRVRNIGYNQSRISELRHLFNNYPVLLLIVKISGRRDQTILENKMIREPVTISDCENCKIVNCDFSSNQSGESMLHLSDCRGCTVSKCKFHDKSTIGVTLKIDGSKTKDNIVEDCEWSNLTYSEGNGGEPLRLGNSRVSHLFFKTIVRNCRFRGLSADVETISIKSCGNIIEHCRHENCKSSFVIRHGHTNTIQDSEFLGEGGIRVYGKGNRILRNGFKNNNSKHFPPLTVVNGNTKDEPNEGDSGSGGGHASYTQVRNNEIIGNTFDNCKKCVVWGRDPRTFKPQDVKFKNNKVIADRVESLVIEFSGGAKPDGNEFASNELVGTKARISSKIAQAFTGIQRPPEPEEEEEEEPEDQQPRKPDPVIEPQIDIEPIAPQCIVCAETEEGDEAKVKLSIHLCSEHAPAAKQMLQRLITELKSSVQTPVI